MNTAEGILIPKGLKMKAFDMIVENFGEIELFLSVKDEELLQLIKRQLDEFHNYQSKLIESLENSCYQIEYLKSLGISEDNKHIQNIKMYDDILINQLNVICKGMEKEMEKKVVQLNELGFCFIKHPLQQIFNLFGGRHII